MKKTLFLFLLSFASAVTFGQLNMTLLDNVAYTQDLSDVWGWVDPDDSTEYAIVGVYNGVSVVSLADPSNAVEVAFLPGANSIWRDIKTWGDYAYVINETSGGLMVIDLTDAPNNITATNWSPNLPGLGTYTKAHNIYIDEFGYAYISGANVNSGGMLIVDVFTTPGTPIFIAPAPAVYAHDVYVRDNKMYASEIYLGRLAIYDVTNKTNIQLLATQQTPFNFTHNAWLNDAGDAVFTTDEKANAPIAAYDISDLNNIVELDQFVPISTIAQGVIPHNVHVWNDWLIISYYTSGGIIVDASKPDNLIEVGNWDSFLGGNGGFDGAWGAYPFLPSGIVLLSDISNGLMVCGADYVRACWLEGTVTDAVTGLTITNAAVHIESSQANAATTNFSGVYKTGQALPGDFDVTFSATGYYPKTVSATLENGVLTILDVELDPISSFSVAGQVVKASDGSPVPGAKVIFQNDQGEYTLTADANGNFSISNIFGGDYTLVAGAWGYLQEVVDYTVNDGSQPVMITLEKGYQDDFILDLGWSNTHTASSGWWVRTEPTGTVFNGVPSNTDFDISGDIGDKCFVTGNGGGDAGTDDVDNGVVTLFSPVMDLSNFNKPVLQYSTWFFNDGGSGNPNDALEVSITNGTDQVVLETITQSSSSWNDPSEFDLASLITLTNNMQVIFETSDLQNSGHLVEAAVDAFLVRETSPYPIFSTSATTGCGPFTVQFSDPSDSTAVWSWTFEGGNPATSSEQNPMVVFDTPGTHTVTLNVTTDDGNDYTIEQTDLIVVMTTPVAGFDYNITGSNISFTNTSQMEDTYQWNFGDNATSTSENPVHNYQNPGIFTVTLTVTNDCGVNTFSQDILILDVPPTAGFSSSVTSGCAPMTIQFTDQSQGAPNTWAWNFPGGTPATSTEQNPSVVYTTPGTYSVNLTVSNGAGTDDISQPQLIQVSEGPAANFTYDLTGSEITFTNTSANATSYAWNFGDNTNSTDENPVHNYTASGQYTVTLTAMNDCGIAVYTETVNVTVSGAFDLDETKYSLTASPNPFSGEVVVRYAFSELPGNASLLVFNVLGEQVASVQVSGQHGKVSLNDELTGSGVYFLRLTADGKAGQALRVVKL